MRWLTAFAVAALGLAWAWRSGLLAVPEWHNPWAPLAVEHPLSWLTRYKLARIDGSPQRCLDVLASAQIRYRPVPDRDTGPGCGFRNAVLIESTGARLAIPLTLSCRSAVSLALWERHVLQPAATAHFGQRVRELEHFGSYACRNVSAAPGAARSRHALADAVDIAGFVLENGRRIAVARHGQAQGAAGAFLHEVHAGACRLFDGVLGPEHDTAHRDHFHLEPGGYRACR